MILDPKQRGIARGANPDKVWSPKEEAAKISLALSDIDTLMFNLFKFVGTHRLDRKVFFTDDQYNKKVEWLQLELKKNGVDLFRER